MPARRCASPHRDDLAQPDVRQRDRAAEDIGDVPGPPQSRHALGVRRVPASRSPLVQNASPRSPAAEARHEVVVLKRKIERPPGVRDGAGHIAPQPGPGRHGTPRSPPGGGGIPPRRRRPSPPTGLADPSPSTCWSRPATVRRPAAGASTPSSSPLASNAAANADAEHGPDADQLVGNRLEPAHAPWLPAGPAHGRDRQLDQVRRALEIPAGQRVADRLGRLAVLLRTTRSPAGAGPAPGRAARRAGAPAGRRRTDGGSDTTGGGRRAGPGTGSPVQRLQHGLAAALPGDRIAQRTAQPGQDRGLQQEGPDPSGWRCSTSSAR